MYPVKQHNHEKLENSCCFKPLSFGVDFFLMYWVTKLSIKDICQATSILQPSCKVLESYQSMWMCVKYRFFWNKKKIAIPMVFHIEQLNIRLQSWWYPHTHILKAANILAIICVTKYILSCLRDILFPFVLHSYPLVFFSSFPPPSNTLF